MITPEEIKKQAAKWWKPFLQSFITDVTFFPRTIDRIGKIQPGNITDNFELLREEVTNLYQSSKTSTGAGYQVKTINQTFRRTGTHEVPDSILFETTDDYIFFIQKRKEWIRFQENYGLIIKTIPTLKDWVYQNCLLLTHQDINWQNILKVCLYFMLYPRPNLYLRQLPIEVHTKFIENNTPLIQSLLDFLIPDHIRSSKQQRFSERFYLLYDEPLIRIRILDPSILLAGKLSDISIPLSDFQEINIPAQQVVITENKMNFLTLPSLANTIAIWSGGGFNISYLKDLQWLKLKGIFYWGDIDEHGFQILHQLRSYYSNVESLMMDENTFEIFRQFVVEGAGNKSENLPLLTIAEARMYQKLKVMEGKNRLEQEKIPQSHVDAFLRERFNSSPDKSM